jgi:glycosyltransferase involved in cell wall biosynthesis
MNIAILTNILTPYRRFVYDKFSEQLKKRGHNFHVILMAETESDRHWDYEEYQTEYSILLKGFTLKTRPFVHINWGLKRVLKELQPDIVICSGSYLYPAVWRALQLRKKYGYATWYWSVTNLLGVSNDKKPKRILKDFVRRNIIGRFGKYWHSGAFSKDFLDVYAPAQSDFIYVPNLIDTDRFESINTISDEAKAIIREKYEIDKGKRLLFTPARLVWQKGILEFLDVYQSLPLSHKECSTYLIAGDGELYEPIKEYCMANDLAVRLLGYKEEAEILELYAIADIFVLPSLKEPFGIVCLEACQGSLPLLVSRHVGVYPEVIKEGINGYTFSYDDKDDVRNKLEELISAPRSWLTDAGAVSHDIANDVFNPEKQVKRIVDELLELSSSRA